MIEKAFALFLRIFSKLSIGVKSERRGFKVFMLPHVTNTILSRARQENKPITPMKLQKLLYFWYMDYKKHNPNDALFSERFEPWKYGPVLADVYEAFKHRGSKPIQEYYLDSSGQSLMLRVELVPQLNESFEHMWQTFSRFDGIQLSKLTHQVNSAWYTAYVSNQGLIEDAAIISDYENYYGE